MFDSSSTTHLIKKPHENRLKKPEVFIFYINLEVWVANTVFCKANCRINVNTTEILIYCSTLTQVITV